MYIYTYLQCGFFEIGKIGKVYTLCQIVGHNTFRQQISEGMYMVNHSLWYVFSKCRQPFTDLKWNVVNTYIMYVYIIYIYTGCSKIMDE